MSLDTKAKGWITMLSIKACRRSLGKYAKNLDDSEVEAIRDLMYQLAFVMVEDYQNKCSKVVPITAERNKNEKR